MGQNNSNDSNFRIPGPGKSVFEGQCDYEGKPHGKGKMKYADGSYFDG